jgi:integrase
MASAYQDKKSGLWYVKFYFNRKAQYKSFETETQALAFKELAETELKAAKQQGRIPSFVARKQLESTPEGYKNTPRDKFFEEYAALADIGAESLKGYKNAWNKLVRTIHFKNLEDIRPEDMMKFRKAIQAEMAEKSVESYFRRLNVIFNYAVKKKHIPENPIEKIPLKKSADLKPYLTIEEVNRIMIAAREYSRDPEIQGIDWAEEKRGKTTAFSLPSVFIGSDIQYFFLLGIFAGLRAGEILNCRWEWIRPPERIYQGGTITVQGGYKFQPKSRQARTIPILKELKPFLISKRLLKQTGYIIKPDVTEWNKTRWDCRKQFNRVLELANCKKVNRYGGYKNVTPHVLRHTFCSLLAQKGVPAYDIQKFAGHSDLKVTEIYMHLSPETKEYSWTKRLRRSGVLSGARG